MRKILAAVALTLCVLPAAAETGSAPEATTYTSTWGVKYAEVFLPVHEKLYLDVHVPDTPGPHPVILWLHTGAWVTGDRAGGHAMRQATRGYAVVSIDYRLAPIWIFPAQLEDAKAAVRWIRANASKYKFDPERVGVFGASAGGHLAALLGTTGGVDRFDNPFLGNRSHSSRVKAVVDYYGPSDLLKIEEQKLPCYPVDGNDWWMPPSLLIGCPIQECPDRTRAAHPSEYLTPDDPPFLLIHGTHDCLVPWQQSVMLHEALVAANLNSKLHIIPGGEHGGDLFHDPAIYRMVDRFLDEHLKGVVEELPRRGRAVRR